MPYVLPNALRFTIPMTLLLAATLVYGRMAGFNELIAAKAVGISPTEIVMPSLVLAFLISLVTCWLNDVAVSWGRLGIQHVVTTGMEDIIYGALQTQQTFSLPGRFSITIKGIEGGG